MNEKLLCANADYLDNVKDIQTFYKSVLTYTKLMNAYRVNNCNLPDNLQKTVNFSLNYEDYIPDSDNYRAKSNSIPVETTCAVLRQNLNTYSDVIDNVSNAYKDNINNDYTPYSINEQSLLSNYQRLVSDRKQLDQDVQKILAVDKTLIYEKQNILDSAVFTTLLWTILATSTLYYAFTKI